MKKIKEIHYYENSPTIYSNVYSFNDDSIVIIDHNITNIPDNQIIFNYETYTQKQNELMSKYKRCFRFLNDENLQSNLDNIMNFEIDFDKKNYIDRSTYAIDNSALEHFFEERFQEVYGYDALQYVHKEFGLIDENQQQYFYDFVVETVSHMIAVEENGVKYHHPQIIGKRKYLKQLDKQNAFAKLSGKLFRWSSQDCINKAKVNEDIRTFFGMKNDFYPKGYLFGERKVSLYDHQVDTLDLMVQEREKGKNTFLVSFPTATGKSKIIEEDVLSILRKNKNYKILIVSPTTAIKDDWLERMRLLQIENNLEIDIGEKISNQITISTYYHLYTNIYVLSKDYFNYIVVDEAHHAVAPMMKRALQYFTPKHLVGLTATPFRTDNRRLEDIFGSYEIQLDLEEAMARDIIVKARAFRIETNLDLSEVRFNGNNYVNSDLEKRIRVQSRNEIIAKTIYYYFNDENTKHMQGIVFCVNLSHTDAVANEMNKLGLNAVALNGKVDNRRQIEKYKNKETRFLCSCSVISEGWDSPQTELVVMARPTISKTLYLQQLGRGFRKHPNKDFLYVIDVVDQYGSLAVPWSINSIFNNPYYVPFGDVTRRYKDGDMLEIFGLEEKILRIEEINVTTFESLYHDYLSEEQTARELYVSTPTLRKWAKRGDINVDLKIPFGSRQLNFYHQSSIDSIRRIKNLEIHNEETIYKDFWSFVNDKTYTFSFKMVFMLSLLKVVDLNGEADLEEIKDLYVKFYLERHANSLQIDRKGNIYTKQYLEDSTSVQSNILTNPFEKFERKRFIFYSKELTKISFNTNLWEKLSSDDLIKLESIFVQHLNEYYANMGGLQNIDYLRRS